MMEEEKKKESLFSAWCRVFRLPNLATVPGDAIAGCSLAGAMMGFDGFAEVVASGVSLLFLYMFGLADNDFADAVRDETTSPSRPIPSGALSRGAVFVAGFVCLLAAFVLPVLLKFHCSWYITAGVLVVTILTYNRLKIPLLMGLCRGLGVLTGVMTVSHGHLDLFGWSVVSMTVLGWILYIYSVTKLSEGEEKDSQGLGKARFLGALPILLPFAAGVMIKEMLPIIGSFFTALVWCFAVMSLGGPHSSGDRKKVVGATIRALLYMQLGFLLIHPAKEFVACACVIWLLSRFLRKMAPQITGS